MGLMVLAAVVASAGSATAEAKRIQPGVFVTLDSTSLDDAERAIHVDTIRTRLGASSLFENKRVDVNVTRLAWVKVDNCIEVHVELAFVMSTTKDEIVSVANQTAKLVMAKGQFSIGKLPALRGEVIDNALGDLMYKLRRVAIARSV